MEVSRRARAGQGVHDTRVYGKLIPPALPFIVPSMRASSRSELARQISLSLTAFAATRAAYEHVARVWRRKGDRAVAVKVLEEATSDKRRPRTPDIPLQCGNTRGSGFAHSSRPWVGKMGRANDT